MNLPQEFIERMIGQLGQEEFNSFEKALALESPVSIRVNTKKFNPLLHFEKVAWCETGYYLNQRPNFASDPLWHAGAYYVQEASSMMLEKAFLKAKELNPEPLKILDLCAAPGGKSTHIASLCDHKDVLVCNEVIKSRVPVLAENIRKQGFSNVIITNADSVDFEKLGGVFDLIVVDAPCSGEGLFRKDPQSINEWSKDNIQTCELRQKRILDSISKCLKPNGIVIYSTCTYNPGENNKQIESLIELGFEPVNFEVNGNASHTFQCLPHLSKGEGFFISMLQNKSLENPVKTNKSSKLLKTLKKQDEWMQGIPDEIEIYGFENKVLGGFHNTFDFFNESLSGIYCFSIGTEIGELKEKRFAPSEYLPFAQFLIKDEFPRVELDQSNALKYLAKNPVMHQSNERGYVLLTFKSIPIGFGKFAGNRINNLFPAEWKLRIMPSEDKWFSFSN
jgi:16S rRNA C967 or C1407 C5-methylase (RsmB/RsmF family)/NOL1/NOP2/fmu family ribosome biogenesis protein